MEKGLFNIEMPGMSARARAFGVLLPKEIDRGTEAGVRAATIMLAGEVQDLLEGPVLNRRTGKLWRSFSNPKVRRKSGKWVGVVGTNVVYAAIHEFGGTIVPKNAPRLVFKVGGHTVSSKKVTMPKRPYVGRTFKDHGDKVSGIIEDHIERRVSRIMGGAL